MSDVSRVLLRIEAGDSSAADLLLPLVYEELRKLAAAKLSHERPGQTLQATALVHEAYLRLIGAAADGWKGRGHFFGAAAEAMRRILIENARKKQSLKRGRDALQEHTLLEMAGEQPGLDTTEMMAVHELLDLLAVGHPRKAEVVKLRYFLGCTQKESAEILRISEDSAQDDWVFAKAWLKRQWRREESSKNSESDGRNSDF